MRITCSTKGCRERDFEKSKRNCREVVARSCLCLEEVDVSYCCWFGDREAAAHAEVFGGEGCGAGEDRGWI
ncbi:hypothetical protein AAC387_Pa03g3805 [Persea americana]